MTATGGDSIDNFADESQPSPYARCPDCGCRFRMGEVHVDGCSRAWMKDPHDSDEWRVKNGLRVALAKAMHDSDGWAPNPKTKEPHTWATCNDEHRARYQNLADRYVAKMP